MANEYLYGAYGHIGETVAQSAVQAGTTPVYIGTAPVNLVRGFGKAGVINAPIKITSLVDAQKKLGYAADWGTFYPVRGRVRTFQQHPREHRPDLRHQRARPI